MSQPSNPLRILVIDDDAMSRDLLAVLLEGEGYAVLTAESGDAALSLLGNGRPPDVILTDLQMPGVTGSQLAAKLRTACPSSLLLAMSGSQPSKASIWQFDDFLLKPFKVRKIADILASRPKAVDTSQPQSASKSPMQTYAQEPAPPPLENALPVLNETIYQQLAGSIPVPQLHEMYTLCLTDARERIDRMRDSEASQDNARFISEAHAIKGSCGMLGATQLHSMAADLEKKGLDNAEVDAKEVNSLDELAAACDRLERMLGSRV